MANVTRGPSALLLSMQLGTLRVAPRQWRSTLLVACGGRAGPTTPVLRGRTELKLRLEQVSDLPEIRYGLKLSSEVTVTCFDRSKVQLDTWVLMDSQILISNKCDLVVPNEVEPVHARRDLEESQYLVNLTFRRVVEEVQRVGQDSHAVALEAQLAAALKVAIDVLHIWIVIETLMKMRD